jgi:hypothetical protein
MIRKYAVELYFFLAAAFFIVALLQTLAAVRAEEQGSAWTALLVLVAGVFSIMALMAADVRQRSLPVINR